MSSLNKAFIQVYKKSPRAVEGGGPHFSTAREVVRDTHVQAVAAEPAIKPVPTPATMSPATMSPATISSLATSSSATGVISRSNDTYVRLDAPVEQNVFAQPWLMSISTIGIEDYVANSLGNTLERAPHVSPPAMRSTPSPTPQPETVWESPLETFEEPVGVVETTPVQEEEVSPSLFRIDSAPIPTLRSNELSNTTSAIPTGPIAAGPIATGPIAAGPIAPPSMSIAPAVEEVAIEKVTPKSEAAPASTMVEEDLADAIAIERDLTHQEAVTFFPPSEVSSDLELAPFHAVWEVDSFQWPTVVLDAQRKHPSVLAGVGKNLRDACRTGLKVLAVTSEGSSQGRTTVALCLAKCAAKNGLRVALIDADVHQPVLGDRLNLEMAHGWDEVVSQGLPLEEAAIHSLEDQVTLIPMACRPNPIQLAPDHPKVQSVLRRLSDSFDLVIADSQHLGHPGGRLVGCGIDSPIHAAILVVNRTQQSDEAIDDCIRRLNRQGIDSVGIVENFQ